MCSLGKQLGSSFLRRHVYVFIGETAGEVSFSKATRLCLTRESGGKAVVCSGVTCVDAGAAAWAH
jgi:hypothetical protein